MAGDVEEFLRKLIEKQMGQPPPQRGPQPQPPQGQRPAPQPPRATPVRRPVPRTLDAEIIEEVVEVIEAVPADGQDVSQHVAQHRFGAEVQDRSGRLGAGVRDEDAALQSHIQQAIGTGPKGNLVRNAQVKSNTPSTETSSYAPETTSAASAISSTGNQILRIIGSPQELRQAFILGEVLRRPDFDAKD